jgi:hypothetical protein
MKIKAHVIFFKKDEFGSTINESPWILVLAAKFFSTSRKPIVEYSVLSYLWNGFCYFFLEKCNLD